MPTDPSFNEAISTNYDYFCDAISFKIIREIGSELGLLNWYILEESKGKGKIHLQRVYAIVCIATLKTLELLNDQTLDIETFSDYCLGKLVREVGGRIAKQGEFQNIQGWSDKFDWLDETRKSIAFAALNGLYFVTPFQNPGIDQFEEYLWKTYLDLVKNRPLFPVVYPVLRNEVCYRLRITDETFDQFLKELIKAPKRIRVYPSAGILDYSGDLAHLHKHLPPPNEAGQFMTFLKITRAK